MIFSGTMRKLNVNNVEQSLRVMENYIRSMQEQLEYTLYNLDSANITSLDTGLTDITSQNGGMTITGDAIVLKGANGEQVIMGEQDGRFVIAMAGKGGQQAIFLDSRGKLVVGSQADVTVDGGRWDQ